MIALWDAIRDFCIREGLHMIGVTSAEPFVRLRRGQRCREPGRVLPGAQSVIVIVRSHALQRQQRDDSAIVCQSYVTGHFYGLTAASSRLTDLIAGCGFSAIDHLSGGRNIPLKAAAVRARLGWYGKNTLLITEQFGSFVALGGVITDAELPRGGYVVSDQQLVASGLDATNDLISRCGSCQLCTQACPTDSLSKPYRLHRGSCLAERSISQGPPVDMGNRLVGCDTCQDVCPYNKKLAPSSCESLLPGAGVIAGEELSQMMADSERWCSLARHLGVSRHVLTRNGLQALQHLQNS